MARMPVKPHNHDFHEGPFCNLCGLPYEPTGKANSRGRSYLFRPLTMGPSFGLGLMFLAIILGINPSYTMTNTHSDFVRYSLVAAFTVIGISLICYRSWVAVDLQDQRIHTLRGLGPFVSRMSYPVSDIQSISMKTRQVYSRYGYRRYHDLYLNLSSGSLLVASSENWSSHWEDGRELAFAINCPYYDDGGLQWGRL